MEDTILILKRNKLECALSDTFTVHCTFSIMTPSIMTLYIMALNKMTLSFTIVIKTVSITIPRAMKCNLYASSDTFIVVKHSRICLGANH
jgi:hypothetical protein